MSRVSFASIEILPQVLQLVVGILGLVLSVKARARGVSGLMVGAFVVLLVTTIGGIVWQLVSLNAASWAESDHLSAAQLDAIFAGVDIPLGIAAALSWLLVVIAVVKTNRQPQQYGPGPGMYAGPVGYPMPTQPGYGYPQPGPGYGGGPVMPPQQPPTAT